jgi:2-dehydro-3-deoxyphosphogluconate aldolase / (4S)-4-hydroxy-2-oxoglutarate aldolase
VDLPEALRKLTILPVLVVDSEQQALDLARALHAGGLAAVEITLRTGAALAAVRAVKQNLPDLLVGAGTVLTEHDMAAVAEAGADFAVSPGLTRVLADSAQSLDMPFLPGVSTASEVLRGMEYGFRCFKLFPASACGGPTLLKAFISPFCGIHFCPTGGINQANAPDYLSLPNVLCVGGSWMVTPELLAGKQWQTITELARDNLSQLRKQPGR